MASILESLPEHHRSGLVRLRSLIADVADELEVGPVREDVKWGQPSYRGARAHESTPVRLGVSSDGEHYGLFVHCQTSVIPDFRASFPHDFRYDGTRGVLFAPGEIIQETKLRQLIAHALRYRQAARG